MKTIKYKTRSDLFGNGILYFILAYSILVVTKMPIRTWHALVALLEDALDIFKAMILLIAHFFHLLSCLFFPVYGAYMLVKTLLYWRGRKMATLDNYPDDEIVWIVGSGVSRGKYCYTSNIKEGCVYFPLKKERDRFLQMEASNEAV